MSAVCDWSAVCDCGPDHTYLLFKKIFRMTLATVCSKAVVLLFLIRCCLLLPLWDSVIVLCFTLCALLYVHSSFVIIFVMGKRELVALLCLSSLCLVIVVWLFLIPRVCLQFVILVFPDHTHYFCGIF